MVEEHDVDALRRVLYLEDRIARPVDAQHLIAIELDLLEQRAGQRLNDVALDRQPEPPGVDDQPAVVGHRELAGPHAAARAIHLDLGDHGHDGAVALGVGEAAADHHGALAAAQARIGALAPAGPVGRRLDHGDVTRVLHVLQPEGDRIHAGGVSDLVDERLAGEVGLGPERIAQVPGAERRAAVEERRDALPSAALVGELVRFGRHLEDDRRPGRHAGELAGQRVLGIALVRRHVLPREAPGEEVVGDDVALRIEAGTAAIDARRSLRIPAGRVVAHVLDADGLAGELGEQRRVVGGVAGVVAAVGPGAGDPDRVNLFWRQADQLRDAVTREVRLLRARPQRGPIGAHVGHRAGRAHAGVRLERPLVLGLDHA